MKGKEFIFVMVATLIIVFIIIKLYQLHKQLKLEKSKFAKLEDTNKFLIREKKRLEEQISILQKADKDIIVKTSKIVKEEIQYNPIFKGKKALEGNYDNFSSKQTRKILQAFGMSVDVVRTGDDIIDKIKNGCNYDIIFTNSTYQNGGNNGIETLQQLRNIEGFCTPVVIHTIYSDKKQYFMSKGFDEFLGKPLNPSDVEKVLNKLLTKKENVT